MKFSTSTAIFRWKPAAWLRVTGDDAASFLQGQFTNELRKLAPGEAAYGLWLTVKGKVLADSFVVRGSGADAAPVEYWVGSYFSPAAVIRERLEAFIIADDVIVEDVTAEWAGISIVSDRRTESEDRKALEDGNAEEGTAMSGVVRPEVGVIFPGRRERGAHMEWVYPVAQAAAVEGIVTGLRELGEAEMAARRIAAAIPAVPADIGPGDLPGEGALEDDAISYTKGCYLGQEVMARLKSMGQVRRRLLRVAGEGAIPGTLPAELFVGPRKVGELRSVAANPAGGWTGLAMVSLLYVSAGATLAFAADAAPVVRLTDTP